MGKAVKALSIVLIVASLCGLVGGGLSVKEALDSKAYWESAAGGDSIGMLEDGLNQLKENEQTYLDGREQLAEGKAAYEEGVKKLEEGQKAYNEGAATLAEKQAEYDAGVKKLEDAKKQLAAGKKKLEEGQKEYDAGKKTYDEGKAQYDAGKAQYDAGKAQYDAGVAALNQAKTLQGGIGKTKSGYSDWGSNYSTFSNKATGAGLPSPDGYTSSGYAEVLSSIKEAADDAATKEAIGELEAANKKLGGGQTEVAGGVSQVINGALGNEEMAAYLTSASGKSAGELKSGAGALSGMTYGQFKGAMDNSFVPLMNQAAPVIAQKIEDGQKALDANKPTLDAAKEQLDAAKKELDAGKAKLDAAKEQLDKGKEDYRNGYGKYNNGRIQLEQGAVLLEEGKAALAEAGKQLEDGKAQLADAEKQIADGEAQLAVFEDGRDQVIAGLNTAIATEAQGGVESIADRLGAGFNFMKNETDLDIDKGLEVVAAARGYASDLTGAVTGEITGKAIGSIVAAVGAVVALIGGLLGLLLKKPTVAGVIALLGGAAAAGGAFLNASAGSAFSQIAGAGGPTLLIATGALTAVAAIPQAIAAFTAKSAAASAAAE